jgi:adenylate cyclase
MFGIGSRRRLQSGGRQRLLEASVSLLALVGLWALIELIPQWNVLELRTFDAYTALAARGADATPIVIVAIDEPSFRELGLHWPFPRSTHARLIDRAKADGAAVVGFDLVLAEATSPPEDQALADSIRRAGNVVLAKTLDQSETSVAREWTPVEPLRAFVDAGARTGEVGVDPDTDLVVRTTPTFPDSFAREIVRTSRGSAAHDAVSSAPSYIVYAGPQGTFQTVHYYQAVLPGLLPPGYFKDKMVLVGLDVRASPELMRQRADLYNSPFHDARNPFMPGVEIHANVIANLLEGRRLVDASPMARAAVVGALVLIVLFSGFRRSPGGAAATLIFASVVTATLTYLLFAYGSVWLSPLLPIVAGVTVYMVQTAVGFLTERRRAQETKRAFAQYVPPEVVHRLVEEPELLELGGEERELTLLFSDLANFTSMSEKLAPRAVVAVLGRYLEAMNGVIYRHGGTVDKYIGDGIMAFWGAPLPDEQHAARALQAAIDMQRAFGEIARSLVGEGRASLAMRIGIHTGNVIVGNVGSRARFAYTAIGDAVNVASRLEGANKAYGTQILLSDATARRLDPSVGLRPVDAVIVKGRSDAVTIFTPCDDPKLIELSRAALDSFNRRQWDASLSLWREILAAYPGDGISLAFLARIDALRTTELPSDWSGATALDKL